MKIIQIYCELYFGIENFKNVKMARFDTLYYDIDFIIDATLNKMIVASTSKLLEIVEVHYCFKTYSPLRALCSDKVRKL